MTRVDEGKVGAGAAAVEMAVAELVFQNGCVCTYWDDDITLCVQSRLRAKSGPAGLAARQINCWTLRRGGGGWTGTQTCVGGGVCR